MSIYMWREHIPQELCFTANTASSTVQLNKTWSPTSVTLETSADGETRTTYTFWTTITLSNIWDKIYRRNTSETTTGFTTSSSNYYSFAMTWSISASWDITYLINKNGTTTLIWNRCFGTLFNNCTSLTSIPNLPATTLTDNCYFAMFYGCTHITTATSLPATSIPYNAYYNMFVDCYNLEQLPRLPATTVLDWWCWNMFSGCSKIKLSTTQTWEYQTEYRIPITWSWTYSSYALLDMFYDTWWTFTWTPTINTTYYTSNTLV